jgi:hypothetical protein
MRAWRRDLDALRAMAAPRSGLRTEGGGAFRKPPPSDSACSSVASRSTVSICCCAGCSVRLFRLNRLKVYSRPIFRTRWCCSWLPFAELRGRLAAAWSVSAHLSACARERRHARLSIDMLTAVSPWPAVVAALGAAATYALIRPSTDDEPLVELIRRASDRYLDQALPHVGVRTRKPRRS